MTEIIKNKRIVVTGYGAISPLGLSAEDSWQAAIAGRSGVDYINPPELADPRSKIAGQVKGFSAEGLYSRKELSRIHRSVQFSVAATAEALLAAGLIAAIENKVSEDIAERVGIRIGTGIGGGTHLAQVQDTIRMRGPEKISPFDILNIIPERVSSVPGMKFGLKGPTSATVAACASGSIAIVDALASLKLGEDDIMVAGGTESAICPIALGGFAAMHALANYEGDPKEASRPFDKAARGFVMAEGAAVLVLETLEHALARKARIYAEIIGYACTADAYHDVAPSGEGSLRAMRLALKSAGISPTEVDYINAHGTSTPVVDWPEVKVIIEAFGPRGRLLVSSTKSLTGHMMGAGGPFEAIMCFKTIETGIVLPTINLVNPISHDLDFVPWKARRAEVGTVVNDSFAFGGMNCVQVYRRYS